MSERVFAPLRGKENRKEVEWGREWNKTWNRTERDEKEEKRGWLKEAACAAISAAILILLALVLTAGVFGVNYGQEQALSRTREEIAAILSEYGIDASTQETLFARLLERIREEIQKEKTDVAEGFSAEDAERLREALETQITETLRGYVTGSQLQELLRRLRDVWEADGQNLAQTLQQMNRNYEWHVTVQGQQIDDLQTKLDQTKESWEKRLSQEVEKLWDAFAQQNKEEGNRLDHLSERLTALFGRLAAEEQERAGQDQSLLSLLETHVREASEQLAQQVAELLRRITQNEKDIQTVFQLVSEGKKLLAATLTDEGVETAADAAFEEIAEHIRLLAKLRYEAGKRDAVLRSQTVLNTSSCSGSNDWSNQDFTSPGDGSAWLTGYFLISGNGGGSGNDIDVDVWINQNGARIYNGSVHSYIPGTGSNAYICYVQQAVQVAKGDRFALGFHIVPDDGKSGHRGNTGSVKQINVSLLCPMEESTAAVSLPQEDQIAVLELTQDGEAEVQALQEEAEQEAAEAEAEAAETEGEMETIEGKAEMTEVENGAAEAEKEVEKGEQEAVEAEKEATEVERGATEAEGETEITDGETERTEAEKKAAETE